MSWIAQADAEKFGCLWAARGPDCCLLTPGATKARFFMATDDWTQQMVGGQPA
jgi:hypothetical protein